MSIPCAQRRIRTHIFGSSMRNEIIGPTYVRKNCNTLIMSAITLRPALSLSILFGSQVIVGCASGLTASDARLFSSGVTAVESHTLGTLDSVMKRDRSLAVDAAAKGETLSEQSFVLTIASEDYERWREAFDAVQDYATALSSLAAGDSEVDRQLLGALGSSLAQINEDSVPTGVSGALAELGSSLIQGYSQASARQVAAGANDAVRDILETLARAIGDSTQEGLRAVVWRTYQPQLADLSVRFLQIEPTSVDARRRVAKQYADILDARSASDKALRSVNAALIELSDAHNGLATESTESSRAMLHRLIVSIDRSLVVIEEATRR